MHNKEGSRKRAHKFQGPARQQHFMLMPFFGQQIHGTWYQPRCATQKRRCCLGIRHHGTAYFPSGVPGGLPCCAGWGGPRAHHNTDENGDCKLSSERGIAEEARITIFVWVGLARSVGVGPSDGHGSGRTADAAAQLSRNED